VGRYEEADEEGQAKAEYKREWGEFLRATGECVFLSCLTPPPPLSHRLMLFEDDFLTSFTSYIIPLEILGISLKKQTTTWKI